MSQGHPGSPPPWLEPCRNTENLTVLEMLWRVWNTFCPMSGWPLVADWTNVTFKNVKILHFQCLNVNMLTAVPPGTGPALCCEGCHFVSMMPRWQLCSSILESVHKSYWRRGSTVRHLEVEQIFHKLELRAFAATADTRTLLLGSSTSAEQTEGKAADILEQKQGGWDDQEQSREGRAGSGLKAATRLWNFTFHVCSSSVHPAPANQRLSPP